MSVRKHASAYENGSVLLYGCKNLIIAERIFIKFDIGRILLEFNEELQFPLNSKKKGILYEDLPGVSASMSSITR
jgi:hypothetical protein